MSQNTGAIIKKEDIMSKILYVASTISHINNFHLEYIGALRAEGHEVMVMARGEGADFDIPFEKKLLSTKNTRCRKKIRKILDKERFDTVILNTSLAAFHVRLAMRKKNRPRCVNIVHGYLFNKKGGIKDKILLLSEKILRKKTDFLLLMNDEDMEISEKHRLSLEGAAMTLGMGAKCKGEMLSTQQVREELSALDKYLLTFVGELSGRKNQTLLIDAVKKLKERIPNILLCLVGDGGARGELEAKVRELGLSENVVFAGVRANPCDFIRASDVYVSASKIEGMPFNIIEALGTDTPIVASDIKGHRDLIKNGVGGFLFELDKPDELVDIILDIESGKRTVSIDVMHAVYEKYSFDNVFPKTYMAIKEAIKC